MRRLLAAGLLLAVSAAASWSLPLQYGFSIGSTLGMAAGSDWDAVKESVRSYFESYGFSVSVRDGIGAGWNMGAFVETPLLGPLRLRLGLAYDEPSAAMRITNTADPEDWVRWIERYRLLEAPAVLSLQLGKGFSLLGGGFGAWRVGDLREIIDGPSDRDTSSVSAEGYADFLFGVTAGVEFAQRIGSSESLYLDVQYLHALSPITDLEAPGTNDFYLRSLLICIGMSVSTGQ
jgi:hypothetical protein